MNYQRILTIQDISCIGQCSLTVALPILSACGLETAVLPSAVLSTHTGGFTGYTFRDLTEDMPAIAAHWKKEGLTFDAFYTGYLGSSHQIDYVLQIIHSLHRDHSITIVDPAMADNGTLYAGFDHAFVQSMKQLCKEADYLLPNLTEACLLTDTPYCEQYDRAYIDRLLDRLSEVCSGSIILTGIGFSPDTTGVFIRHNGHTEYWEHRKIAGGCHGTGDIFASVFTGSLLHGFSPLEAVKAASAFVLSCIEATIGDQDHRYGVKFELVLPELVKTLYPDTVQS